VETLILCKKSFSLKDSLNRDFTVMAGWRLLHNEGLNNLYLSLGIIIISLCYTTTPPNKNEIGFIAPE
jgi:hypothetical protein